MRYLEYDKSQLVDILQGQQRSTLRCGSCGHSSREFEPFLMLSLPVTKGMENVLDCLNLYLAEEILSGDESWHCPKCKTKVEATKKIDLWKLPHILVLQLKRFAFDATTMSFRKLDNKLTIDLTAVDLSSCC